VPSRNYFLTLRSWTLFSTRLTGIRPSTAQNYTWVIRVTYNIYVFVPYKRDKCHEANTLGVLDDSDRGSKALIGAAEENIDNDPEDDDGPKGDGQNLFHLNFTVYR